MLKKISLILLLCYVCNAATYYVDATGGADGNTGTATDQAWQTITKVESVAFSAGDSILFKRGETWTDRFTIDEKGTTEAHITFGAYGSGANPIISGGGAQAYSIDFSNSYYVDISDIDAQNATIAGYYFYRSYSITLQDLTASGNVKGFYANGDSSYSTHDITFTDCIAQSNTGVGFTIDNSGAGSTYNFTYTSCQAIGNGTDGFAANQDATGVLWEYCISKDHTETAGGAGDGFTAHQSASGIMKYCWAENNAKSCICFITTTSFVIYGNVLLAKSDAIVGGVEADGSHTLYNNTIYCSAQNGGGIKCVSGSITSRNNIVYGFSTGIWQVAGTTIDTDYECVYNASTAYSGCSEGSNSRQQNPQFTTIGSDFSLQQGSPCIGGGTSSIGQGYDDILNPGSSWPDSVSTLDQDDYGDYWEMGGYVYNGTEMKAQKVMIVIQ